MKYLKTMALCLFPVTALAEQNAECELQFFPVTPQPVWVENFDLCNNDIREFVEARALGFEFYSASLEQLSYLDHVGQLNAVQVVRADVTTTAMLELDLRLPLPLIQAILSEAIENGADVDWDVSAFQEALLEIRSAGATKSGDTFNDVKEYAPIHTDQIFFVNAVRRSVEAREDSARRLEDSARRLEDSARRLEDSAETLGILEDALNAVNGN